MPTIPSHGGPRGMLPTYTGGNVIPYHNKTHGNRCAPGNTLLQGRRRHRKVLRDSIYGITKPAIRRLARRGGVKRISEGIYNEIRRALKERLETIIGRCVIYVIYRNAKTLTVDDVTQSLRGIGQPIWGFGPDTFATAKKHKV
ncbi:histone-fold-containing protein [Fusarium oxysporum]|nr:histone-fold-containing protein [Fusarium oxysporum]